MLLLNYGRCLVRYILIQHTCLTSFFSYFSEAFLKSRHWHLGNSIDFGIQIFKIYFAENIPKFLKELSRRTHVRKNMWWIAVIEFTDTFYSFTEKELPLWFSSK